MYVSGYFASAGFSASDDSLWTDVRRVFVCDIRCWFRIQIFGIESFWVEGKLQKNQNKIKKWKCKLNLAELKAVNVGFAGQEKVPDNDTEQMVSVICVGEVLNQLSLMS